MATAAATVAAVFLDISGAQPHLKRKDQARCGQCKKKLGIMGIKCRCGSEFCISHSQCEMHNCTCDLQKDGKELLRKQLDVGKLKLKIDPI